ncbi:hypothetical protein KIW84_034466 [Lathyrus oleraceus]|uniref:Uncharacterized protein n=1 Tax=Pisum sativum TaxID=3888 RepID=A0A9D4XZJ1_PEA|nr:hypothetical protein KIW84_034466 [Pisum sativum]
MTYAELYPSLVERKLIIPRDPPAIPTNPQWWYKPELHCVYHSGAPGHDMENCYSLKTKRGCRQVRKDIQEMLDEGVIEILQNRDGDDEVNVISPVFRIPEPVVIRYDGSKQKASPPLIVKPAAPVPYSSNNAVPYRYNDVALEDGKEVPLPSTSVVNIADVSGLTRSGRVFSAPSKPQADIRRADNADCVVRPVGNAVVAPNPALVANKPATHVRTHVPAVRPQFWP